MEVNLRVIVRDRAHDFLARFFQIVKQIDASFVGFVLTYKEGEIRCRRVIIAAGGYAAPSFGTDGSMLRLLKNMGIR
ncbi:MAG: NAD(P)/FAD-dependent oxidoreductase, partial [Solobacterium sp.]|nr:NAD(P)/FAD-dependent oxidoreductase [Solobacterium sp.]